MSLETPWLTEHRDEWLGDVRLWVSEALVSLGLGDIQALDWVQERHWSAVLRVTTPSATAYFKAGSATRQNEAVLLGALSRRWEERIPTLLATDEARSWMLMADHGQSLRIAAGSIDEVAVWERLLPAYAEMQQSSVGEADVWIRRGLPDRTPCRLTARLREAITAETGGAVALPLEPDERRAMEMLLPTFEKRCQELAATPFSAGLDHGDLHSGNVLVRGDDVRLSDWGDACVTHPFCSVLVTFQLSLDKVPWREKPAAARRLRDAYLEAWTGHAPRKSLEPIFETALWAGHIVRALDWAHLIEGADTAFATKWRGHIADLLRAWARRHEFFGTRSGILDAVL